jgi:hypothetical protein
MKSKIILMLVISSLIIGCVDNTNKNNLSPEEQKLIETWSIKTQVLDGSFTLNSDRSGVFSTQIFGKMYFKWKASNGMLYTDAMAPNPLSGSTSYKLINNDKTITIGNVMSFDKSWW